jgi:hypothetical protein
VTTPQEKGNALEDAVAAIESLILQTSPANAAKPIIEKKKVLRVGGVRHEIDVYVTIDSAAGYKSVYIFECKNWQDTVGKNEIIVFSEKIDASMATCGYFVAKSFSADAEAQAKKDSRLVLLSATEHDPNTPVPVEFFSRFPQLTNIDVKVSARGSNGLNIKQMKFDEASASYLGNEIDLRKQIDTWSKEACNNDVQKFNSQIVPEGVYEQVMDHERRFASNEFIVNGQDIEKLNLHIDYRITVARSQIVSHFEVESRGRFFRFAPTTVGDATVEGMIVFSSTRLP